MTTNPITDLAIAKLPAPGKEIHMVVTFHEDRMFVHRCVRSRAASRRPLSEFEEKCRGSQLQKQPSESVIIDEGHRQPHCLEPVRSIRKAPWIECHDAGKDQRPNDIDADY